MDPAKLRSQEEWKKYWAEWAGGVGKASNMRSSDYDYAGAVQYVKWHMGLSITDKVLDVGCGNGYTIIELVGKVNEVVGVDLSPQLLEAAKQNLSSVPGSWSLLEPLDIFTQSIPIEDNYFDRVVCLGVFQYSPGLRQAKDALSEMVRVCKPGGKILVGDVPNAAYLPSQPGMQSFQGADLALGYDFVQLMSNYEPFRRFDLFVTKREK